MADTTEAKPISWEAVRALAMVVGVREAARRMHLSEEQVKKRCTREGWLATPEARIANQQAVALRSGTSAPVPLSPLSPAALISAELAELGGKTKLGIARGLARAADVVGEMGGVQVIDNAHEIKSVAQTASLVHSWDRQAGTPKIRLELLASKGEVTAIDIESEVVSDDWAEDY